MRPIAFNAAPTAMQLLAAQEEDMPPRPLAPTPFVPAAATPPAPAGMTSYGVANARANAGVYDSGSFAAQNAVANGTGRVAPAGLMPEAVALNMALDAAGAPSTAAPRRRGSGRPAVTDFLADDGLDPMMTGAQAPRGGPAAASTIAAALPETGVPGLDTASRTEALRAQRTGARQYRRDIMPAILAMTPMAAPTRENLLASNARAAALTATPPEVEANSLNFLDKLAVRAAGLPAAPGRGAAVRGVDPAGRPTLTQNPTGETAADGNRRTVGELATVARTVAAERSQPRLETFGQDSEGRPIQGIVSPAGNVSMIDPPKPQDPVSTTAQIGGRTLTRFGNQIFDERGQPVRGQGQAMDPIELATGLTMYQQAMSRVRELDQPAGLFRSRDEAKIASAKQAANAHAAQLGYDVPFPDQPTPQLNRAAQAPVQAPAQPPAAPAAPAVQAPAAPAAAPAQPQAKLYTVRDGQMQLPTGDALLPALNQALADGMIAEAEARRLLEQQGFKRRNAQPAR